jgi:predicted RNA-binding Zn ribbon-like protein
VALQVRPETTRLFGGALSLDFANSVDWSRDEAQLGPETDALRTPADLARWGRRLGVLGRGGRLPDQAELAAARAVRAAIHAVFSSVARESPPPREALARLLRDYAEAAGAGELARSDGAWRLEWARSEPRRLRFAVADDAVRLLGDAERLARVRRCPGANCGWLFLDASGRRKWCSMGTCGSRAKMRRLYERQRAAQR